MKTPRFNKLTKGAVRTLVVGLISGATMPLAWGDASTPAPVPASGATAFEQCANENQITLPAKGSGERLNADQRHKIGQCVRTLRKAAFATCASQKNITLPAKGSGQRLSKEQRGEMKACMAEAGFPKFHHHRRFHNQPPTNGSAEGSSQQAG